MWTVPVWVRAQPQPSGPASRTLPWVPRKAPSFINKEAECIHTMPSPNYVRRFSHDGQPGIWWLIENEEQFPGNWNLIGRRKKDSTLCYGSQKLPAVQNVYLFHVRCRIQDTHSTSAHGPFLYASSICEWIYADRNPWDCSIIVIFPELLPYIEIGSGWIPLLSNRLQLHQPPQIEHPNACRWVMH